MEINRINSMSNLIASYEKIMKTFQRTKTKNDFFHFVEIPVGVNFFIPCRETGLAYTKNLSFFGKCALTLTNSIPLPDFPTRDTGNQYPISENPTGKKWGFLHKNSLGLPRNRFYLLKHIIWREVNRNFCIHREIRRRIKNFSVDPGERFSGFISLFYRISFRKSVINRFEQYERSKIRQFRVC